MRIGYACIALGVEATTNHTCSLKNATLERLNQLIVENLTGLEKIIAYNRQSGIRLFRISSDIIPFGSHPVNILPWWDIYGERLQQIGKQIKGTNLRVSMHPGQYTVLSSPDPGVVERSVADLVYHTRFLDALGLDQSHKIIIHLGGVYGDKNEAIVRFRKLYLTLPDFVRARLVIENDEKSYSLEDVLAVGNDLSIPVIYDHLHQVSNPSAQETDPYINVRRAAITWSAIDGIPKIHYSDQALYKPKGAHATTISCENFLSFYEALKDLDVDIMLEVKDKDLSAKKCINLLKQAGWQSRLEEEWARYKYLVLEKSPSDYQVIRGILKEKHDSLAFYQQLEKALKKEGTLGTFTDAALHVWGYFKTLVSETEKDKFFNLLEALKEGKQQKKSVKRHLHRLAKKYQVHYLLNSYFFLEEKIFSQGKEENGAAD